MFEPVCLVEGGTRDCERVSARPAQSTKSLTFVHQNFVITGAIWNRAIGGPPATIAMTRTVSASRARSVAGAMAVTHSALACCWAPVALLAKVALGAGRADLIALPSLTALAILHTRAGRVTVRGKSYSVGSESCEIGGQEVAAGLLRGRTYHGLSSTILSSPFLHIHRDSRIVRASSRGRPNSSTSHRCRCPHSCTRNPHWCNRGRRDKVCLDSCWIDRNPEADTTVDCLRDHCGCRG